MRFLRQHSRQITIYMVFMVLVALIQVTFLSEYLPLKIRPDLILVFAILCGYLYDTDDGILIGLIMGFLRDMLAGRSLGLGMLLMMYAGLLASVLFLHLFKRNIVFGLVQVLLISTLYHVLLVFLDFLFPALPDQVYTLNHLFSLMIQDLPGQLAANLVAAVPLMLLLHFVGPYPRGQRQTGLDETISGDGVWHLS